jgi:hypothetical protein
MLIVADFEEIPKKSSIMLICNEVLISSIRVGGDQGLLFSTASVY